MKQEKHFPRFDAEVESYLERFKQNAIKMAPKLRYFYQPYQIKDDSFIQYERMVHFHQRHRSFNSEQSL
jgi:hypothetical protein